MRPVPIVIYSRAAPRLMARMHIDELEIDEALVRRLLVGQFPEWAELPLQSGRARGYGQRDLPPRRRAVCATRAPSGHDDVRRRRARLAAEACPRAPTRDPLPGRARPAIRRVPVVLGRLHVGRRRKRSRGRDRCDPRRPGPAAFVSAMQHVDPAGAPLGRGIPLAERAEDMVHWFARFQGGPP